MGNYPNFALLLKLRKMNDNYLPLFGNTCGKIYNEYILLASENNERTLPLSSVKKITFSKRISLNSLLFTFLPAVLLVVPQFMESEDVFIKIVLYVLGILFLAISVYKAEMISKVNIFTTNGSVLKINVIKDNRREAKKFVAEATKLIVASKAERSEQHDEREAFAAVTLAGGEG